MHRLQLLLYSVLFLFLVFIFPTVVSAASSGTIEVQPAYVDVDLRPPVSQQDITIRYTNHSSEAVTLELFPIDFQETSPNGDIGFLGQDASTYSYSLSSFLSFETNRLDLSAGETKVFHLQAQNRQDLTPGGHYAAVIAKEVQSSSDTTTVAPAVSTLIFLRKEGGERFNLSLLDLSWPDTIALSYPPTITALFKNDGNVHLTPTGVMEVKDMFGRLIYKGILNEGFVKVLPESERYIPIYLKQVHLSLPVSLNTMIFTGTDSLHKVTYSRKELFLYVHPLAIFFPLFILGIWFVVRKRKK